MKTKHTTDYHDMNSSRRNFIKRVGRDCRGPDRCTVSEAIGSLRIQPYADFFFLATVAICNTTSTPADSYVYDDAGGGVKQKVKYLLDLLDQNQSGAVAALFGAGKKVAIKINLTGGSGTAAELHGYTITDAMWTNPAVLQAVGQYIIDAGVSSIRSLHRGGLLGCQHGKTPAQQPPLAPMTNLAIVQYNRLWVATSLTSTIPPLQISRRYRQGAVTSTSPR